MDESVQYTILDYDYDPFVLKVPLQKIFKALDTEGLDINLYDEQLYAIRNRH
jgi:hypothetical protein